VAPAGAFALDLKLHPVGQGKDTHASWIGGIGEAADTGNANQTFLLTNGTADGTAPRPSSAASRTFPCVS
jgi:hypothetical protein